MTDIPGTYLSALDISTAPDGAQLYAEKGGLPVRLLAGEPGGLGTLGGTGIQPAHQAAGHVSVFEFLTSAERKALIAGTSTADLSVQLQRAFDEIGGNGALDLHGYKYRIAAPLTLTGKTNFTLLSQGAELDIAGAFVGLTISACDGLVAPGLLRLSGHAGATGVQVSGCINTELAGFRAKGLALGGIFGSPQAQIYGGVVVPDQTRLLGFSAIACGTGFRFDGEYYEIVSPHVRGCTAYGIQVRGGNFSGVGGVVNGNRIGLFVDGGVVANSDHGKLVGTTVNHNLAAGIYLTDTQYAFHVTGCDVWATIGDGTTNGQLTEEGRTTSFGIYARNCEGLNVTGNTVARNRVNVGIDGVVNSSFAPNHYIADPTRTTSHIKEFGGNHDVFARNAQNIYGPNIFEGALLGGNTKRVEVLATSLSQAHRLGGGGGTTGTDYLYANLAVVGPVVFDGQAEALVLTSDCPAAVSVAPALFTRAFTIAFVSVSGGSKSVAITAATSVQSLTSGMAVAGDTVTFKASGTYLFTPIGIGQWVVSCAGGSEAVIAPALLNSWANLGGVYVPAGYWRDANGDVHIRGALATAAAASGSVAITLPAGYRPAFSEPIALATDTGRTAWALVATGGGVTINYEAGATFVSFGNATFRTP